MKTPAEITQAFAPEALTDQVHALRILADAEVMMVELRQVADQAVRDGVIDADYLPRAEAYLVALRKMAAGG